MVCAIHSDITAAKQVLPVPSRPNVAATKAKAETTRRAARPRGVSRRRWGQTKKAVGKKAVGRKKEAVGRKDRDAACAGEAATRVPRRSALLVAVC